MRAASGSTQMLYSAAGVTLPTQQGLPPITTTKPISFAIEGAFSRASARLVKGPSVTSVNPGFFLTVSTITSGAQPAWAARRAAG